MRLEDLTGKKFGRLVVEGRSAKKGNMTYWKCRCECGCETSVRRDHLISGEIVSCGCFQGEAAKLRNTTHGWSKDRLFRIWKAMRQRCASNPNYAGRGITVCDEWANDYRSFRDWSITNGYNDTLSIDRIDNNAGYSPANCRWASATVQNRNTRHCRMLSFNGVSKPMSEWAEMYGISASLLRKRLKSGWSVEKAITTPKGGT